MDLKEKLQILKDLGVGEYSCAEFRVVFNPVAPQMVAEDVTYPDKPEPKAMWHTEKLWPGGKPPEFQKYTKETGR